MRKIRQWLRSERGDADPTLVAGSIIAGVVVAGGILMAAVSFISSQSDVVNSFNAGSRIATASQRFDQTVNNATDVAVASDQKFTVTDDPQERRAYYVEQSEGASTLDCRKFTWAFVNDDEDGSTKKLQLVQETWTAPSSTVPAECAGTPDATSTTELLSNIKADTAKFSYKNAYGRTLTFRDGVEQGAAGTTGEQGDWLDVEWTSPVPYTIQATGTLDLAFGGKPKLEQTSVTRLDDASTGVVVDQIDESLARPTIDLPTDDTPSPFDANDRAKAKFSTTTPTPSGHKIMWTYQTRADDGSWTAWHEWTDRNYVTLQIFQGHKIEVRAQYQFVTTAGSTTSMSPIGEAVGFRRIDTKPQVVAELPGTSTSRTPTIRVTGCPAGTTAQGWYLRQTTTSDPVDKVADRKKFTDFRATSGTLTDSILLQEGEYLGLVAYGRCISPYVNVDASPTAEKPVVPSVQTAKANYTRPVTTKPATVVFSPKMPETGTVSKPTFGLKVTGCPVGTVARVWGTPRIDEAAYDDSKRWNGGDTPNGTARSITAGTDIGEGHRVIVKGWSLCVRPGSSNANGQETVGTQKTSTTDESTYIRQINAGPTWGTPSVTLNGAQATSKVAVTCVAGTTAYVKGVKNVATTDKDKFPWSKRYEKNDKVSGTYTDVSGGNAVPEGAAYLLQIAGVCQTPYATSEETYSAFDQNKPFAIRPISNGPVWGTPTVSLNGAQATTKAPATCVAGTTPYAKGVKNAVSQTASFSWSKRYEKDAAFSGSYTDVSGGNAVAEGAAYLIQIAGVCQTDYAVSKETYSAFDQKKPFAIRKISKGPTWTVDQVNGNGDDKPRFKATASCVAGAKGRVTGVRNRFSKDATNWYSLSGWYEKSIDAPYTDTSGNTLDQGKAYFIQFSGDCYTHWIASGKANSSGAVTNGQNAYARDITTKPSTSVAFTTNPTASNGNATYRVTRSGCPAGTSYSSGSYSGTAYASPGGRASVSVGGTRCYAKTPVRTVNGPYGNSDSATSAVRPYPAPAAPSDLRLTWTRTGADANTMLISGSWAAAANATSYNAKIWVQSSSSGGWSLYKTGSGIKANAGRGSISYSTYWDPFNAVRLEVQSVGSGGASGWVSTTKSG